MLSALKTGPITNLNDFNFLKQHPLPTWIVDPKNFTIFFVNDAAITQYGFSTEELLNNNLLHFFDEESKVTFFHKATQAEAPEPNGIYGHTTKSGTKIKVELYASLINYNEVSYYQVTIINVTDKLSLHSPLEEETQRYKSFIEQSSEGIFCQEFRAPVSLDQSTEQIIEQAKKDSYISECNDAMARMYGYEKADELKGVLSEQMLDYTDAANIEYLTSFISNGCKIVNAESHEKDRHGNTKYFLNSAIGIIENGYLKRVWGTQQDITNTKKTKEKFQLLANLVEQTSDILTAADLDYKPITWNKAAEKIYGITSEQVIGRYFSDFITLHYQNSKREDVRKIIAEQGEWRGETFFVRPTDKKTITLWMSFKLLKDDKGQSLGYLVSATDITERKEAESKLKESENRFKEMADSSPVMIWMSDENNVTTYLNKKWLAFTGKDITGDPHGWENLVHKDDITKAKAAYNHAFQSKKQVINIYRLLSIDGSYRWVHDVSVPRFLDGRFIGYIGSVVDIEDQKHKEKQLLYQATVLENVSEVIITTDLQFTIRSCNKIAEACYDKSEPEVVGTKLSELSHFTFYGTSLRQSTIDLQRNGIWQGEVSIINKKGETKYFLHTVKYLYDEKCMKIGFLAVGRDITDRKMAEEKMKQSELFYRTLIADSLDGMILLDAEGKITFSSPSVKNVLGYEVEDILDKNAFEFVHTEDLLWAAQSFQKEVVENPEIKSIVVRLLQKTGEWLWCRVRGHNMLKNSNINGIAIYFHDDTLRKQASDALKESEKRFRYLIRDLKVGVILQDKEGKTLLCNDAFAELFSVDKEEIAGKSIQHVAIDPIHEDGTNYKTEDRPTYKAIHTKQGSRDIVMGIYRPRQNDRIWLMINADPILDKDGEILHIICSAKDITERKKMEQDQVAKQIFHQKQITQATIDGQEKERVEIGKELHDNIGQQLTTIKLFLDLAKSTADDGTNEMVSMALKGVSDVINEVRSMSRSLVPSTLKDLGLIESINELSDSISRTQFLKIELDYFDFDEDQLPENQKLTLFRIIQEQLNNIVKHAGAKQVNIELHSREQGILLEIKDDGNGFDPQKTRKGLGFMNIKNRAELFGGKAEIISNPGEGCLLKVSFPNAVPQLAQ